MYRTKIMAALIALGMVLSACSSAGSTASATSSSASQASSSVLSTSYDNALSVEMQLAFGTLKLEDSANAIDSQTAAQLAPLWRAIRSLEANDSAAEEEIQAVYRQIQESMTSGQLQAIAAMKLTSSDMREIANEMGMNIGAAGGAPDAATQSTMEAAQASGEAMSAEMAAGGMVTGGDMGGGAMPSGGGGGGMPGGDMGGGGMPGGGQTSLSSSSSSSTSTEASDPILDAVITYLEGKIA